jgi:L,D-transpeptidase ErfK/SrfK
VIVGASVIHVVQQGDTLSGLGARVGIEPRVIAKVNSLRADARLQVGQQIVLDNRHIVPTATEEVVINIPQRLLFVFHEGGVAAYPVAVGRSGWPTFTGPFTITTLEMNPAWDVPVSIQEELRRAGKPVVTRVPPGPANPLGAYWIGLSRPGFGIHGTNAPSSIYRFVTHGCIRLHPDDAARVFASVAVGMPGRTVYEPFLFARLPDDTILFEAHPDVYRRVGDPAAAARALAEDLGVLEMADWTAIRAALRDRDGVPIDVTIRKRGI